ncbi:hypothetical protein B566_EDAN002389 [Ephemera danica]|nr:hypothetical protein B566_EDAN002389 [Ephemera danica]
MASNVMNSTGPSCSPCTSSSNSQNYVYQAQQLMQTNQRARNSLLWSTVNSIGFSVFLYDLLESCSERNYIVDYLEFTLMCIFLMNTLYHVTSYLILFSALRPVPLTQRQKKLLGVSPTDVRFPTLTPQSSKPTEKLEKCDSRSSLNLSSSNWLSSSLLSRSPSSPGGSPQLGYMSTPTMLSGGSGLQTSNLSTASWSPSHWSDSAQSPNLSMSSSWVYQPGSPSQEPASLPCQDEPVTDEASLQRYLQQCEALERKQTTSSPNLNSSPSNLSLLWNSSLNATSNSDLVSPTTSAYHLAPLSLHTSAAGSPGFDAGAATTWLTMTVLEKLSKEIDAVNLALQRLCASDDRIGTTGLERLKKTASMPQVAQHVPNLSALLPFLELSTQQNYIVMRIKDLAQGGCMSNFRWNSGGSYNGKPWDESLPTDCAQ